MINFDEDGIEVTGFKTDNKILVLDCDNAYVEDKELEKVKVFIPNEVIKIWIDDYDLLEELDINV